MRIQLLVGRHNFDGGTDNLNTFRGNFLKRYLPYKTIQTHSAVSLGITVCGERMISARRIIARTLGRQSSQKHRTGIDDAFGLLRIILGFDYQVFGSIFIGQSNCLIHISD